jgi:pilus assembly protein CpaC
VVQERNQKERQTLMNRVLMAIALQAGLLWGQAPPTPPSKGQTGTATSSAPAVQPEINPAGAAPVATHQRALPTAVNTNGQNQPASPQDEASTLHLVVDRSLFIDTAKRMRRIYVSNPSVLDALAATPHELVVTAKAPGTSSLVVWDESGVSTLYTVFSDIDIGNLRVALEDAFPEDRIAVKAVQGKIYLSGIVGSDGAADQAATLAGVYAKDVVSAITVNPRHPTQVRLQVKFVEIDRSKMTQFGFNFLSLGQNVGVASTQQFNSPAPGQSTGGQPTTVTLSDLLNLFYFNRDLNLGVIIKDLQTKGILQILAEPSLTTIDGQPAKFLAGGEFPFPVVQGSSGGTTSITIQFKEYGVRLQFTPFVNPDGTVRLKVNPEVSALDFTNAVTISGYTIPAISTRRAETEVELKNGQSFGISGLLDHRITDNLSKMPGISEIPVLGQLFRSKNLNHSVTELFVIVTPTVVDPLTGDGVKVPTDPKWPVPFLDPNGFDMSLPGTKAAPSGGTATGAPK